MLWVFISSVQKEMAEEGRAVKDFVTADPLLKMGETGRSTHYVLARKVDINRTNSTWYLMPEKCYWPRPRI